MRQILYRGEFKKDLEMSFGILGNLEHSLLGVEFPELLLSFDMIFIVNKIVQESSNHFQRATLGRVFIRDIFTHNIS